MYKISVCSVRVSTNRQETDLQLHALQGEIKKRGLTLVPVDQYEAAKAYYETMDNVCVLVEDKRTGRNERRKGYQWALGMIRGGWVKSVIVYRADRIGRSVQNNLAFAEACLDRKVELFSLKDGVDIQSPSGMLIFSMLSAVAKYESDVTSERVKDGLSAAAEAAKAAGRPWHHGGTAPGWASEKVRKDWIQFRMLVDDGASKRKIRRLLGWNYRTIVKFIKHGPEKPPSRREMNLKIYGKTTIPQ